MDRHHRDTLIRGWRLALSTFLVASLLVVAVGCGTPSTDPVTPIETTPDGPKPGGTLRVAIMGNPPTLDIQTTTAQVTWDISKHIFETLFALDSQFRPVLHLLDDYEVSEDARTYGLHLRQGVLFHDGSEMTAQDVVASLKRWGELGTLGRDLFRFVESITAADTHTVSLKLTDPIGIVPLYLADNQASIYPASVVEQVGNQPITTPGLIIGTGPYKLKEFAPDIHVELVRHEGYASRDEDPDGYAGRREAYLDAIRFIPVPEASVRIAGVRTGDYHFGYWIPADDYNRLKDDPAIEIAIVKPSWWSTAVFNKKEGLFADRVLRQAALAALDMEAIMRAAHGPQEFWRLDPGIMFREFAIWTDAGIEYYDQRDPARARELLQQAGYDGTPIRWVTTREYPYMYTFSLVSKAQLEAVGFNVDLQVVDWATLISRRSNPALYDVFSTGFGVTLDPVLHLALSPHWPGWYESDQMQAYLDDLRRETDFDVRKDIWAEAQALFWEDVPVIKYGDWFVMHIHRGRVQGFVTMPDLFFWNTYLTD